MTCRIITILFPFQSHSTIRLICERILVVVMTTRLGDDKISEFSRTTQVAYAARSASLLALLFLVLRFKKCIIIVLYKRRTYLSNFQIIQ